MVSGLGVTLSMEWQPAQFARAKIIPRWAWADCAEAACTRHNDAATAVRASQRAPVLRRWPAPSGQKALDKRRMLVVDGICKRASLAILFLLRGEALNALIQVNDEASPAHHWRRRCGQTDSKPIAWAPSRAWRTSPPRLQRVITTF